MQRPTEEQTTPFRIQPYEYEPADWPPEKVAAARTIRRLMEFWQIEPEELAAACEPEPAPPAEVALPPKYRHPATGDTWDGQGHQPDWLKQALLKEGYTVEELRVPCTPAAAPTADELGS